MLFGSTTLTGTVITQFNLRAFRFLIIPFVLLWALSPIGSQALDRLVAFAPIQTNSSSTLQYMDANSSWPDEFITGDTGSLFTSADALFQSSLAAPMASKTSPQDIWGNLKVPTLEYLPLYSSGSPQNWISVNSSNTSIIYSSLLGLPVAGLSSSRNTTFNLTTAYAMLECPVLGPSNNGVPVMPGVNATNSWGAMSSKTDVNRCNMTNPTPREIYYYSWDQFAGNGTAANCSMTTSYVDVSASCNGLDCSVTHMRRSVEPTLPPGITPIDGCDWSNTTDSEDVWPWYGDQFVFAIGQNGHPANPSPMQIYFQFPADPFNTTQDFGTSKQLYTIGNQSFSRTLAQLMNTFWIASIGSDAIFLGHPDNFAVITDDQNGSSPNLTFSNATANLSMTQEGLVFERGWMAALLLSTSAMVLASFVKLFVDLQIITPNLLMNVTTLTRNNPYFGLPPGGTTLGDAERSRLVGDISARFGDALPHERAGMLVIGNCIEEGGEVATFQRGRKYE